MSNPLSRSIWLVSLFSIAALASGPSDRKVTDPQSVTSPTQPSAAPVKVEDLLQITRMAGAAVSPEGNRIALIRDASGRLNLWVMNSDGGGARQLLHSDDRQGQPVFSPEGDQIIYVQDKGGDEMYDLFAIPVSGGEPRNLTGTEQTSETVPLFSRDGKLLAFSGKQKSSASSNLAVMDWPSGSTRQLTHEHDPQAAWTPVCWSPDGKFLFAVRSVGIFDSDIYRIEVNTASAKKLTPHSGKELMILSDISPDGKTLLLHSNRRQGYQNVALLNIETKQWRWVTDTKWEASAGSFAPDGKSFTYTLNADGRTSIEFVDAETLKAVDRGLPVGLNSAAGNPTPFARDGSFYFTHQDSIHPADLYVLSATGKVRQLTHNDGPALSAALLPPSQLIAYKSFDGLMISAFLWTPFNLKRDGSAPAVVMPHGGPTGQVVDSFNSRAALLASRGFVIIAPNVRGSTGYGLEFEKANIKDLGGADLKDEIAGVDFLKATGFVDAKKIGIWGGSYGGFMTLMAIGKTPDVWSAAVDEYGILNWLTMLQHEDPRLQEYEKGLLGDPLKDREVYENCSPLKYIRNERAPLLVLQGERDIRVPKEEAEQLVTILKAEGRTVDAVYYAQEGHGFLKREHQIDELSRSVAWLQLYLQEKNLPQTSF